MAINNPYIPGDPFSYDLKWLVRKIKEHGVILDGLDERIQDAILEALSNLDQLGPQYFENVDGLQHSVLKDKALAYVEGFYTAGDGGANLYFVTTDYNDVLASDFYVTLDGPNRWAIPIVITPYVMPEMFGAVGDGTSDDTAALQTAATYAHKMKADLITETRTYYITDTVTIDGTNVERIQMNGVIKLGMNDRPGVKFINCTRNQIRVELSGTEYNGGYSTPATDFDFPVLPFVGALFENTVKSEIYVSAENCHVGARFLGDSAANCFNTVNLGMMVNNAINLELASNNGGWVNDNMFLNGNFSCWSDNAFKAYHVDIFQRSIDGVYEANNNIFLKPSFEGGGLPIYIKKGSFNQFRYIRCENGTADYSKVEDGRDNVFDGGYGVAVPVQKNAATSPWQISKNIRSQQLMDLVPLHKWEFRKEDNIYIKATTNYWCNVTPGVDFMQQNTADSALPNAYYIFAGPITPEANAMTFGPAVVRGFYVDVTNIKTLYCRFTNEDGANTGRFAFRFFDSNFNTIQPALGTEINTDSNFSFFYQTNHLVNGSTTYAGAFVPLYLNSPSLKYVFVGVQYFSALSSIEVFTTVESTGTNPAGKTFVRQPKLGDVVIYPNGIATNCEKGRVIMNAPQAANGDGSYNFAYVCTDATNQTWAALKSGV